MLYNQTKRAFSKCFQYAFFLFLFCQSLELLLCDSSLELEQMRDTCGSIQQQQQESQQRQKEKDAILNQLQVALQARTQEVQVLTQKKTTFGGEVKLMKCSSLMCLYLTLMQYF